MVNAAGATYNQVIKWLLCFPTIAAGKQPGDLLVLVHHATY